MERTGLRDKKLTLGSTAGKAWLQTENQPMTVRNRLLSPDLFQKVVVLGVGGPSTERPRAVVGSIRATAAAELFAVAAAPLALRKEKTLGGFSFGRALLSAFAPLPSPLA